MMAMNDSVQSDFNVKIQLDNVPDSVIFITDPPQSMHVTVRDQGTSLLRQGVMRKPTLHINFNDYSEKGLFRFTPSDMKAALKVTFGKSASILSQSLDSITLDYSTGKGRTVPVVVSAEVEAAPGSVIMGKPSSVPVRVKLYGASDILDTIHSVFTQKITRRHINEPVMVPADIKPIKGVRVIPSRVEIRIEAEPLVRKEVIATIRALNVPDELTLVLFPSKVPVEFYVPMSRFGDENPVIEATVDYSKVGESRNGKLGVVLSQVPAGLVRPSLVTDSVEYSVVR